MKTLRAVIVCHLALVGILWGNPSAKIEPGEESVFTGQRWPFVIEIRADGVFDGAPAFDLPRIPQTVIVKTGSPVLGSLTIDGVEYFTQRHQFSLFSQARGKVVVPPIGVRFASKKGYTAPSFDHSMETAQMEVLIKRPPGTEEAGFLVTADSLQVEESWQPEVRDVEVGAVFKRSIRQRAEGVTAMALAPPDDEAPDGVRVYSSDPEVRDRTARGEMVATRTDVISYLIQQPGVIELPELRYDWWDPESGQMKSSVLSSVSLIATAPPLPPEPPSPLRYWLAGLVLVLISVLIIVRKRVLAACRSLRDWVDPPRKRDTRRFLRSCRKNDADQAMRGWGRISCFWIVDPLPEDMASSLNELFRGKYGRSGEGTWSGADLASAFENLRRSRHGHKRTASLPSLNGSGS